MRCLNNELFISVRMEIIKEALWNEALVYCYCLSFIVIEFAFCKVWGWGWGVCVC